MSFGTRIKKDKSKSVLSRADFSAMAEIGEKTGVFKEDESKIIKNLLRFNLMKEENEEYFELLWAFHRNTDWCFGRTCLDEAFRRKRTKSGGCNCCVPGFVRLRVVCFSQHC